MKERFNTRSLVLMGLLVALQLVFSFTPIGTIPIGPLSITLQTIPIAIAAIALGPVGGLVMGSVFGILSFLQCIGVGIPSGMGAALFAIDPVLAFVQRFVPRALDGLLVGFVFKGVKKLSNSYTACAVTGFCTALFNTVLFMSALVLLFGSSDYVKGLMGGKNVIVFICTFVGVNAVVEMISTTLITAAVGAALFKAKLIPQAQASN